MSAGMVINNLSASRYEMQVEGQTCFIEYDRRPGGAHMVVVMLHAEVPFALRGRKLGEQLVQGALELVRQQDERVIPSCAFVAAYIRRHPEYQSLLATS